MGLETFNIESLEEVSDALKNQVAYNLESGKVVFFPKLPFLLEEPESQFLNPTILNAKSKNVSYDVRSNHIQGTVLKEQEAKQLKSMIGRFALHSQELLKTFLPTYFSCAKQARTSYRPAEAAGRKQSQLKDDTLLHVDSFPSNPVAGHRILRVFSNINPNGKARVWKVGEPFTDVLNKMMPRIKKPLPGSAHLLNALGITKGYRTLYDHYMLQVHNAMKKDPNYQQTVPHQEICFPPGSTWMVYTDLVSHAVLSGQFVLEQTFYVPPEAMHHEELCPLRILEKRLDQKLV